jgi:hypothetical protein
MKQECSRIASECAPSFAALQATRDPIRLGMSSDFG